MMSREEESAWDTNGPTEGGVAGQQEFYIPEVRRKQKASKKEVVNTLERSREVRKDRN